MLSVTGNLVDILQRRIYPAKLSIDNGRIGAVEELSASDGPFNNYILPGFIDAHVHIESSMMVPAEFARLAVMHGTIATVSDPHEIANVCGMKGVEFMIENGKKVPFYFYFGAPSCVPATRFETAGATIGPDDIAALLAREDIHYLTEMMNFPGVLADDEDVLAKIAIARRHQKPVDGHAPALRAGDLDKYIAAGISTDHECFTAEEGMEKLQKGMKVLIREGSAARNFDALIGLMNDYPNDMMFCSDDKHPDSLLDGHINELCARAVAKGIDVFDVLRAACINPVLHYHLRTGLLRRNDAADFIIVEDLTNFRVLATFIRGKKVAANGQSFIGSPAPDAVLLNNFSCSLKNETEFALPALPGAAGKVSVAVIEALDGQLITNKIISELNVTGGNIMPAPELDILKITVVNRYRADASPAVGFIKNFGLKQGAIASSVAHDSHNIVAVGVNDEELCRAVNLLIEAKGGICCVKGEEQHILPLPVAGLMSAADGFRVAEQYKSINGAAKELGSSLSAPFMTLSFMALLVIPHLKLSDMGLFDGDEFKLLF